MAIPQLPERWSFTQRLKNTIIYFGLKFGLTLLMALPANVQAISCRLLGRLAYRLALKDRRRAEDQLRHAYPNWDEAKIRKTIEAMFDHLGLSIAELLDLDASVESCLERDDNSKAFDTLREALAENRGAIVVTGHIGNWELLAQSFSKAGFDITTVAKPTYDPRLTELLKTFRGRYGMSTLWRGDARLVEDMFEVFARREAFGILIDQDTKVPGDFVPFFGRLAFTPTAAAMLHRKTGAPVLIGYHHRTESGQELNLKRVETPIDVENPNFDRDFTAQLTHDLEEAIKCHPEQWVWLHQRWKTQPSPPRQDLKTR